MKEVFAYPYCLIFQVALYLRKELNIKTGTNFILSLAAFHKECRPFLKRYFNACVVLPSDWIDVAEFYQVYTFVMNVIFDVVNCLASKKYCNI